MLTHLIGKGWRYFMAGMEEKTYQRIKENLHLLEFDINFNLVNRKPFYRKNAYATIAIKGCTTSVHQIIAFMKYGRKVIGMTVNHIDGNKWNNHPNNLELATPKENSRHMVSLGLFNPARGSRSGRAKLTEPDVIKIRELLSAGEKPLSIAGKFGVSDECIYSIKNGKSWTHVG
jgi:hypothetical protein